MSTSHAVHPLLSSGGPGRSLRAGHKALIADAAQCHILYARLLPPCYLNLLQFRLWLARFWHNGWPCLTVDLCAEQADEKPVSASKVNDQLAAASKVDVPQGIETHIKTEEVLAPLTHQASLPPAQFVSFDEPPHAKHLVRRPAKVAVGFVQCHTSGNALCTFCPVTRLPLLVLAHACCICLDCYSNTGLAVRVCKPIQIALSSVTSA